MGLEEKWESATRMIMDGIMSLETVSKLSGLDIADIQELDTVSPVKNFF